MKFTITFKFMLIYLLVLVITLATTTFTYIQLSKKIIDNQVSNQLVEDSNMVKSFLFQSFNHHTDDDNFSNSEEFTTMLKDRANRYMKYLNTTYLLYNKFDRCVYSNQNNSSNNLLISKSIEPEIYKYINYKQNKKLTTQKITSTMHNRQRYSIVITPITKDISSDLEGGFIVVYSQSGLIDEIQHSLIESLLITIPFSFIFILIISLLVSRSLSKPILQLKKVAEQITKRDFNQRTNIKSKNEIGQLGSAINSMAESLKQYDIAQKNFLQNASHELKTPLMSIQGYAEGLSDGIFDNPSDAINVIVSESNRLKSIVDNLITITKLETDGDNYNFEYVDLKEISDKAILNITGITYNTDINFIKSYNINKKVYCDYNKILQALINVLSNAVRHCNSEIQVIIEEVNNSAIIKIIDDGKGFNNNEEEKIFLRFYKGKKGNCGLGLAITKAIIEFHKGEICAKNLKKRGACIIISLPLENI